MSGPHASPVRSPASDRLRPPEKGFALRPSGLVPWGAIGDTALDCVIIGTHHPLALAREAVPGGVA
ncbi:hypothetical protein GCM10027074_47860 [Streptomyces deserti]